ITSAIKAYSTASRGNGGPWYTATSTSGAPRQECCVTSTTCCTVKGYEPDHRSPAAVPAPLPALRPVSLEREAQRQGRAGSDTLVLAGRGRPCAGGAGLRHLWRLPRAEYRALRAGKVRGWPDRTGAHRAMNAGRVSRIAPTGWMTAAPTQAVLKALGAGGATVRF